MQNKKIDITKATEIILPYNFAPRTYQEPLFERFDEGYLRGICVCHRRWGKDVNGLNLMVKKAHERIGTYFYCFPTYAQGKKVLWNGRNKEGKKFLDEYIPKKIIKRRKNQYQINETEMRIELKCGSMIQIIGADKIDSVMGTNPIGIIFSEFSLMNPYAWDYFMPILDENGGWALFIYTPRGENHAYDLHQYALTDPKHWFVIQQGVNDTHAIDADVLERTRQQILFKYGNDALFRQEYHVDYTVPISGAYYAKQISDAYAAGRVGVVSHIPNLPVHTVWDLGVADTMPVWFMQFVGAEVHVIDYEEFVGKGLSEVIPLLKKKPYVYGRNIAPHDIKQRELTNGKSRLDTAMELGWEFELAPNLRIADGIDAVRDIFPKLWFDKDKCKKGLNALKNYRRAWDEERKIFSDQPLHDWSSHPADALRMFAVTIRPEDIHTENIHKKSVRDYQVKSPWDNPYRFDAETC